MKGLLFIMVISLLVLSACSLQVECNEPYITVGSSCCLDKNSNSICDYDESPSTPTEAAADIVVPSNQESPLGIQGSEWFAVCEEKSSELLEFERAARLFGSYESIRDFEKLYDMTSADLKTLKTKEYFIEQYPKTYAIYVWDDSKEEVRISSVNWVNSYALKDSVMQTDSNAIAYFDIRYDNGYETFSYPEEFVKEGDDWKYDGYYSVFYGGCTETAHCYDESVKDDLLDICAKTCEQQRGNPSKIDDELFCEYASCKCKCFDDEESVTNIIYPDYHFIKHS